MLVTRSIFFTSLTRDFNVEASVLGSTAVPYRALLLDFPPLSHPSRVRLPELAELELDASPVEDTPVGLSKSQDNAGHVKDRPLSPGYCSSWLYAFTTSSSNSQQTPASLFRAIPSILLLFCCLQPLRTRLLRVG
jgi:hypothetical protein